MLAHMLIIKYIAMASGHQKIMLDFFLCVHMTRTVSVFFLVCCTVAVDTPVGGKAFLLQVM